MSGRVLPAVPPGHAADWTLHVDGHIVPCRSARLESRFGTWSYGLRPGGFDGWWFAEQRGGGAVTLPFSRVDGELFVGLIEEDRANMGGVVLCALGGFVDPGESHVDAARRETLEEAGLDPTVAAPLPGLPVVSNRLFFAANPHQGQGVHMYAFEVESAALTRESERMTWASPQGAEVREIVFLPWREAVARTADALALAAIARLLAAAP